MAHKLLRKIGKIDILILGYWDYLKPQVGIPAKPGLQSFCYFNVSKTFSDPPKITVAHNPQWETLT